MVKARGPATLLPKERDEARGLVQRPLKKENTTWPDVSYSHGASTRVAAIISWDVSHSPFVCTGRIPPALR
jgi:hypothetical protein